MDEPVNCRDEDPAEQRRQRPDHTADEKRLAAKFMRHHPGICQHGGGETDVDDRGDDPDNDDPKRNQAGGEKEVHGRVLSVKRGGSVKVTVCSGGRISCCRSR